MTPLQTPHEESRSRERLTQSRVSFGFATDCVSKGLRLRTLQDAWSLLFLVADWLISKAAIIKKEAVSRTHQHGTELHHIGGE